jgi:hypothetical protein
MAREIKKVVVKRKTQLVELPFTKTNYQIIGIGIVVIILGYIALSMSPWDGLMPLVVAPILLVIGYCVIIPLGILLRKKQPNQTATEISRPPANR